MIQTVQEYGWPGVDMVEERLGVTLEDDNRQAPLFQIYEAAVRRSADSGIDKAWHFIKSAASQADEVGGLRMLLKKVGTDAAQYFKEIVYDEIPSWVNDDDGYSKLDMRANNQGQAFGLELGRLFGKKTRTPDREISGKI